jgi:hypothetical protein
MPVARAKIDLTAGTIELEGTEEFVTRYLDEFKLLLRDAAPADLQKPAPHKLTSPKTPVKAVASASNPKVKAKPRGKKGAPKVIPTRFDVHGGGDIPSLKDFFESKKPGAANGVRIAVIAYYITELLGNPSFSEGQIDYAYKMLKLGRPGHLHQVMINNKNEKDLYEQSADDPASWLLTRTGEIFVDDQLPPKAE